MPGTYIPGESLVTIAAFAPTLHVITSKQRPRKLSITGGDLQTYGFLLKGHEDLRQDERVRPPLRFRPPPLGAPPPGPPLPDTSEVFLDSPTATGNASQNEHPAVLFRFV